MLIDSIKLEVTKKIFVVFFIVYCNIQSIVSNIEHYAITIYAHNNIYVSRCKTVKINCNKPNTNSRFSKTCIMYYSAHYILDIYILQ